MIPKAEFHDYRLVKRLGRGGMGEVYLAIDCLLDRQVAIKFITAPDADSVARKRFFTEARAFARLQHPNVVSIYRVGIVDDMPYLVSEYVEGEPLSSLKLPLTSEKVVFIAAGIARGLAAAHLRGVIHRDIKPANVILTAEGEPKLLDFGIAKLLESVAPDSADSGDSTVSDDFSVLGDKKGLVWIPRSETTLVLGGEIEDRVPGESTDEVLDEVPSRLEDPARVTSSWDNRSVAGVRGDSADSTDSLTETGTIIGTPKFVAPEIWLGHRPTFQSDIFSFGVLIYYLITGEVPHDGTSYMAIGSKIVNDDAISLKEKAPHVEPRLARIVDRCLKRRPEDRYPNGNELRMALAQLTPEMREDILPEGNPYRGLYPFEAEHQSLFFGRDSEIRRILERLKNEPFLLVAGDSGVGKSSLCRAGVIPRVGKWMGEDWTVVTVVPGPHPVISLSEAVAPIIDELEEDVEWIIKHEPASFARMLKAHKNTRDGILIFIDQMEELVTLSDPEESEAMARLLGWLTIPAPGIRLLATVRGDFVSRLAALPSMVEHISRTLFFLKPLSRERIHEAVVGPAQAKGARFESDALVAHLVNSTIKAQGGLPLLQFALSELWTVRDKSTEQITRSSLERIGGVEGALSRHADNVMAQLLPEDRVTAKKLLLALVTSDGTRARKTEEELGAATSLRVRQVLDALVRGRLLVARTSPAEAAFEISHEALLTAWPTIAGWLSEDVDARFARERLRAAVKEWHRLDHAKDALWSDRQLREIAAIDQKILEGREREFILRSHRRNRRSRLAKLSLLVGIPLIGFLVYGAVVLKTRADQTRRVNDEVHKASVALKEARQKSARANEVRERALALFRAPKLQQAESVWDKYVMMEQQLQPSYSRAGQLLETAFSLDRSRRDVRDLFADLLVERALLAEKRQSKGELAELLQRLVLYDDGTRRAAWNEPAELTVQVSPEGAAVEIEHYELADNYKYSLKRAATAVPNVPLALIPGSYLLTLSAPNHTEIRYPVLLNRGEKIAVSVTLPPTGAIPPGYAYVPAGRFLFGSSSENTQRRDFLHTTPIHARQTGPYLIAVRETTFAEWFEFLRALPDEERVLRIPRVAKGGFQGALMIEQLATGLFEMTLQPASQTRPYVVKSGEPLIYPGRDRRKSQDWLQFPVFGITVADAEAYAKWLDESGRLKGARLCSELEWERGARGADSREYPHGERLDQDDANFDDTYSKIPLAMGPDEVGSHPLSRSPFGLDDMAGNVWEWTRSVLEKGGYVARGGSYYFGPNTSRSTERAVTEPSFRDTSVGMRICSDF